MLEPTILSIPFSTDQLQYIPHGDGYWVPVQPVCLALGLSFSAELERLALEPWARLHQHLGAEAGRLQQTVCLDHHAFGMWLATVPANGTVNREKLIEYQRLAPAVLEVQAQRFAYHTMQILVQDLAQRTEEHAAALRGAGFLKGAPPTSRSAGPPPVPLSAELEAFKRNERAQILEALAATGWNRQGAAKRLGIPRRTFYRRLTEYGLKNVDEEVVRN